MTQDQRTTNGGAGPRAALRPFGAILASLLSLLAACGGPPSSAPAPASSAAAEDEPGSEAARAEPAAPRVPDALIAFAPCTDDYRALCEEVDSDEGAEVIACLREHRSALDRHCLAALDPEAPQVRSSRCVAAIRQLCPDADDPPSRTECIRRHDELEPLCQRSSGGQQGPPQGGAGRQGMGGGGLGGGGGPF
jgi:hypothetical protein